PALQDAGEKINISCNVTDDISLNNVKVNISGSNGFAINSSIINNKIGDIYYYNRSYLDGNYSFIIWAEDNAGSLYPIDSNHINHSYEYYFNVTPITHTEPPQISDVKSLPLSQAPGENINITCNVTDNLQVERVHVVITYPDASV